MKLEPKHFNQISKEFEKREPNAELIYASLTGSHLHGTETPDSDIDIKGIYLPCVEDLILQKVNNNLTFSVQIDELDKKVDCQFVSIQFFLNKLVSMECNAVELLFSMNSNKILIKSPASLFVYENKNHILRKDITSFLGMAEAEVNRYWPKVKERNYYKDFAHGLRSLNCGKQFLETGEIVYPLENASNLKNIKMKQADIDLDIEFMNLEQQIKTLRGFYQPERSDESQRKYVDETILDIYENYVGANRC